jgi:predicted small lipoprotein YifL
MNRKGLFLLLLLIATLALSLAACSGGAKPTLMYFRSGT